MKRIFAGVQPTGTLHLGNYLGAIKNWLPLQYEGEATFFIVDLHAITVPQNPVHLQAHILETAAIYLAAGINPERSTIFVQSMVSAYSELMWILSCHTPLGWLNRMTQYKEKAQKNRDRENMGLYAYPVLMAADILGIQATHVPVGEDQKQHLEFTRDLAQLMNRTYDAPLFTIPEPHIVGPATRVMSLRDGTKKMSKSETSDFSRINLLDAPDLIRDKIRKAKTDAHPFPAEAKELKDRPEIENLINIYRGLSDRSLENIFEEFGGQNLSEFKTVLTEELIATFTPLQEKFHGYMKDKGTLHTMLKESGERAQAVVGQTLNTVKKAVGLYV